MLRTAIVVPVKGDEPKRRLQPLLNLEQRKQLQIAMLEDTLQTAIRAGMIRDTYVVSSNVDILELAKRFNASAIAEASDAGVNSAVKLAITNTSRVPPDGDRTGTGEPYSQWLVIPADLPLLSTEDLKIGSTLVRAGAEIVISPSESYDGTNLLLLTRASRDFELSYDNDSFHRHTSRAYELGLRVAVYYSKGIAFDVDSARDVHRFFKYGMRSSTLTFLARSLRRQSEADLRFKSRDDEDSNREPGR